MALTIEKNKLLVKGGSLATGLDCCCEPPPPPPPECLGACCVEGLCSEQTQAGCRRLFGTWFGCDSQCTESLCTPKEDCVDDCCPEVPDEISVAVVVDPVFVCYTASINPFNTIFVRAVIEEFAVSETLTLPLAFPISPGFCPVYFFSGTIEGVRYDIQVNLTVDESGICVWEIVSLSISKCSEENTEDNYRSSCPLPGGFSKYGVGLNAGDTFPDLGVTGCVGGTVTSIPISVGFNSDFFCDPLDNRICEGNAANCVPAETTVTVTISV